MYAYEGNDLRAVIPKKLRQQMVTNIHAAHQGTTSILSRARQTMYWPGMDRDINRHSEKCKDCQGAVPSNTKEPMIPTEIPKYSFQHAASDLFEINGHHYLVYVDHLTDFRIGILSICSLVSKDHHNFQRVLTPLGSSGENLSGWWPQPRFIRDE